MLEPIDSETREPKLEPMEVRLWRWRLEDIEDRWLHTLGIYLAGGILGAVLPHTANNIFKYSVYFYVAGLLCVSSLVCLLFHARRMNKSHAKRMQEIEDHYAQLESCLTRNASKN